MKSGTLEPLTVAPLALVYIGWYAWKKLGFFYLQKQCSFRVSLTLTYTVITSLFGGRFSFVDRQIITHCTVLFLVIAGQRSLRDQLRLRTARADH